ncbi:MAG: hypothetical protein AAGA70_14000 [Pseudomonadota bacterium]
MSKLGAPFGEGLTEITPPSHERMAERLALVVSVIWFVICMVVWFLLDWSGTAVFTWRLGLIVPIGLIWLAVSTVQTSRQLKAEAQALAASIAALQRAEPPAPQAAPDPTVGDRLEKIVATQAQLQAQIAALGPDKVTPAPPIAASSEIRDDPQTSLSLGTPAEALQSRVTIPEFIKAVNFPDNENDTKGFDMLRKALRDRATERVVRASQDVLTLLSQDGIYMDDLRPDRARPEVWRAFARGDRGRAIAGLGGVHDRSGLALAAGRMRQDPVFRDAVHHFLRSFDHAFIAFEKHASDEEIIRLADTRTARAFMLLGRVTGTFD